MANPRWAEATRHILIVRLSPWKDVEQSTSHIVLFTETRRRLPRAYIDFAFLPSAADRKLLSGADIPWFFGRQSGKSPADFDLVMISNAFGLELLNLSHFFFSSGIPESAATRSGRAGLPVIIAGGSNAVAMGSIVKMSASSPNLGPAEDSLVDGIFFGEGEGAIGEIAAILTGEADASPDLSPEARRRRLREAARVKGFWPCLYGEKAERAVAAERASATADRVSAGSTPLVLNGPNALVAKLAVTAGCPGYCSFCMEGWDRRPYAETAMEGILLRAKELRAKTGADTLELYSFNFNTHSRIFELIYELNRIFPHVSLMSQRLDILADTRGLFETETAAGKRSFTFGIEGISARMRAYYRKGISGRQIEACLDMVFSGRARELKLFFIIAGIEDGDDIEEFTSLMRLIGEKKKSAVAQTRVLVSAGFLVRLPFTPLQYAPLELDSGRLRGLSSALATSCEANGIEYRTASTPDEHFVDQTISLAGGALFPWMSRTAVEGLLFDSGISRGTRESLGAFCDRAGLGATGFMDEKSPDYRPPLAFVESDSHWVTLRRHYESAKRFMDRAPCLGGTCSDCGVCENPEQRRFMTGHSTALPATADFRAALARLLVAKAAFTPVFVAAELPAELARSCRAYRESWISRCLCTFVPGSERLVFRVSEELYGADQAFGDMMEDGRGRYGLSVFALFGPDEIKLRRLVALVGRRTGGHTPGQVPVTISILPPAPVSETELRTETAMAPRETMRQFASTLRLVEGFRPPRYISAAVEIGGDWTMQELERVVERYLEKEKLVHTTIKRGTAPGQSVDYEFPAAQRGKRLFSDARLHQTGSRCFLTFSAGDRIRLSPLLKTLGEVCGKPPLVCVESLDNGTAKHQNSGTEASGQ